MAYTTIDKSDDYFNTSLWTGTGSTQSITGVNFQPDFLWVKTRSTAANHRAQNSVIGAEYGMNPNQTVTEGYLSDCVTSFDSDGFTLGADSQGYVNTSSRTYVGWSWLASNTTASNTDGSITSTVSANTTSGFSIVSYTGNGTAGATVGHGLGTTPAMIIVKSRSYVEHWQVYHTSLGATKYMQLSTNEAVVTASTRWNNTEPTSSVFTLGNHGSVNQSSGTLIAYCFAEKKGFSKFGSYTGNGSADGTFVYTGFKPAWVMVKKSSGANAWLIHDVKRSTINPMDNQLFADFSNAEDTTSTNDNFDFLSNGFKARNTGDAYNGSGGTYIYMAFASNPFVTSTSIPTTAR